MKKIDFLRSEYFKLLKQIKGPLIINCNFLKVCNLSQCLLTPGVKKTSYVPENVKHKQCCGLVIPFTKRTFFSLLLANDQRVFE